MLRLRYKTPVFHGTKVQSTEKRTYFFSSKKAKKLYRYRIVVRIRTVCILWLPSRTSKLHERPSAL